MIQTIIPSRKYKYAISDKGKDQIKISCYAIKEILKMDVPDSYKKSLMHNMIWKISGAEGKNITRYCSLSVLSSNEKAEHEHVFTINSIKERFLNKRDDFDKTVKLIVGCLVSKDEHVQLTSIKKHIIGWERYKNVHNGEIVIYDMSLVEPQKCNIDELINEYIY